jgi:hypothetical protein
LRSGWQQAFSLPARPTLRNRDPKYYAFLRRKIR